ncbi:MAG: SDR family oxidoreductase [Pseudomonadota bacterium]
MKQSLFIFGLGYSGTAIAKAAQAAGWQVAGTVRTAEKAARLAGLGLDARVYDGTDAAAVERLADTLRDTQAVVVTMGPDNDEAGAQDAVLRHANQLFAGLTNLQTLVYLSTIGVYGDRGGAWIDETADPDSGQARSIRRVATEKAWTEHAERLGAGAFIMRLGGIYGPGRSPLEKVRNGEARRIIKPGQVFNRIHVADIAGAVLAAIENPDQAGIYNVVDDQPTPPQDVIAHAAGLLGLPVPPDIAFEDADMSPMGRAFYANNKRVRNDKLKSLLDDTLVYPSYEQGLKAELANMAGA